MALINFELLDLRALIAVSEMRSFHRAAEQLVPLQPAHQETGTGIRGGPSALIGRQGPYRFFNPLPFSGKYDILEEYLEVAVPVLKDSAIARNLDLNGAVSDAAHPTSSNSTIRRRS